MGTEDYQFSSVAKSVATLHVGEVELFKLEDFNSRFNVLLSKASERKGAERSAAGERQGHQKTPAFIHALFVQAINCRCALKCNCEEVLPKGGFTDVGRHTGGEARDTCFALVRSVCHWSFDQSASLVDTSLEDVSFDVLMVHFHSYVLETSMEVLEDIDNAIDSGSVCAASDERIDYLGFILKRISTSAAPFSDNGHDLCAYYDKMELFRARIKESRSHWDEAHLKKSTMKVGDVVYRTPNVDIPAIVPAQDGDQLTEAELRKRIQENIGHISLIPRPLSIDKAAAWAGKVKAEYFQTTTKLTVYLRQIENVFWRLSEKYLDTPMSLKKLDQTMILLDLYREALHKFVESKHVCVKVLSNRMRSIELLLVWVGYCMAFNAVSGAHATIMNGFGVALRFSDLRHLLLQDSAHIKVMKRVAKFLRRHRVDGMDIFSTRSEQKWNSPTFLLGARFGKTHLNEIWQKESKDAADRVAKHWNEVLRKQALAKRLRIELKGLEMRLAEAREEAASNDRKYRYNDWRAVDAREALDEIEALVNSKQNEIKKAEEAPPPVVQPLPNNEDKALKVLFFLYMSKEFQHLSRLSFTAQQLLVPSPWTTRCGGPDGIDEVDVFQLVAVKEEKIEWNAHYNGYQKCIYHSPSESHQGTSQSVDISMYTGTPDTNDIGPRHVDLFSNCAQGVWYPDESNIRMMWCGGHYSWDKRESGKELNPFLIQSQFTGTCQNLCAQYE